MREPPIGAEKRLLRNVVRFRREMAQKAAHYSLMS